MLNLETTCCEYVQFGVWQLTRLHVILFVCLVSLKSVAQHIGTVGKGACSMPKDWVESLGLTW